MTIFLIIVSCLLWIGAFIALPRRIVLAPGLSYCALVLMSLAKSPEGYNLFPVTNSLLYSWLAITLIIMMVIVMQSAAIRIQSRGVWYMTVGAVAGMLIGLACLTVTSIMTLAYALMIIGTAAGIVIGYLLFTNTPSGQMIKPGTGNFFRYLLAKGFPILITVAQLGIILVIITYRTSL
ncbi:MAG: hypothetical protein K2M03_02630 [Muribaculaceae bacterium]|nr:hypothetical protein [Muribaculaceae bacterium]MDE6294939.1 hypothetical protein [Muribaculaceae bacterium]